MHADDYKKRMINKIKENYKLLKKYDFNHVKYKSANEYVCSSKTSQILHYENTPIQIYWKFYHQKMKIFR